MEDDGGGWCRMMWGNKGAMKSVPPSNRKLSPQSQPNNPPVYYVSELQNTVLVLPRQLVL